MVAIGIVASFLCYVYFLMYREEGMNLVWAADQVAKPQILYPMYWDDGSPIVYEVDLSDWELQALSNELDVILSECDEFLMECYSVNGLPLADDSNLSCVQWGDLFGAVNEDQALNYLSSRNAA